MRLADYVLRAAASYPRRAALVSLDETTCYRDLADAVRMCGRGLASLGLRRGDRVALLLDNSVHYVAAYFGTLLAGYVAVPLNTDITPRWLAYVLEDCDVSALIYDRRLTGRVGPVISGMRKPPETISLRMDSGEDVSGRVCSLWEDMIGKAGGQGGFPEGKPDELAVILYTSGTTGTPKGVMLSHENLAANTESIVSYLQLQPADRVMAVLSFNYSYGNSLLLTHMAAAGSVVIDNRFAYPNAVLKRMQDTDCTGFSGVPSTFGFLLHRSAFRKMSFPALRYVTQAGGGMSPAMTQELKRILPGVKIFIMYGQTEASARLSYLDPDLLERKLGSIGKAIPGVELSLVREDGSPAAAGETGEIVARGGNIMLGYWNAAEETGNVLRDGRLFTGDLAWRDEDGFFFIVGRKKDIIKSSAYRISPKEIEDVLMESGFIDEAAVIGIEDELLGEAVKACIVLKEGVRKNASDVVDYCKSRLATYKIPKHVEFFRNLPKTRSGKIKKGELKNPAETSVELCL
jgi:acyl-CoA synthetase (AMP-forming)/AMP-acid ligase II